MSTYDKKINKLFYYWLIFSFFLVFTMIVVGGLTRLTNSGLSITEWELFTGILPPLNQEGWNKYFLLYKEIPQFKLLNNQMTLDEFKTIFYWEYFHRILGRLIGLAFLLPLIFFYISDKINKKYLSYCLIILLLIIFQGFVGWYMVKSGLVNNTTVSHYRLSLHLSVAFLIISLIFWLLINIREKSFKNIFTNEKRSFYFYSLIILLFLQIIIGAFVSGLDAGKIYQTWPLMNYTYFPNDVEIKEFKNLFNFNDHALIHFYHRNIAYFISFYIFLIGFYIVRKKLYEMYNPFLILFIFLFFQIFLGIITLISNLNIYLASAHQICSLLLTLSAINLYYYYIK